MRALKLVFTLTIFQQIQGKSSEQSKVIGQQTQSWPACRCSHPASRVLRINVKRDGLEMDIQKCYGTKVAFKYFALG